MCEKVLRTISLNISRNFHLTPGMPKSKKKVSEEKNKNSEKIEPLQNNNKGAVYVGKNNEIIVRIHAKPGAKESTITDIGSEAVGIQIGAPPVDGEANKELIRFLAEVFNLRKSDLSLDKGSRSKEKTVIITKDASLNNILDALKAASKQ